MVMERTLRCIADNIAAGSVDWLSICLIRIVVAPSFAAALPKQIVDPNVQFAGGRPIVHGVQQNWVLTCPRWGAKFVLIVYMARTGAWSD